MPSTKLILFVTVFICGVDDIFNSALNHLTDDIYLSDLNSDAFLDSFGFLERYGYPSERVSVTSEDGYITTMVRIPRKGPPVLLVHGVTDSSDGWLVLGPGRSLAYELSDRGFDVWLFNFRGNRYSKGHKMDIPKKQYWDFSYEEMGTQDLPASIDYILNTTSYEKISYVGFSQGTTIFLVMCSMRPEYNNKIQVPILLAPVAWISYIRRSPVLNFFSSNIKLYNLISNGLELYELFPYSERRAFETINCHRKYPTMLCNTEFHLSLGLVNSSYLSPDRISVVASHLPAGVSAKNLLHFIQMYGSKRFQRFDYGLEKNLEIYSSKYPPLYNVKRITVPINIIASESDWLSSSKDVKTLLNKLPNVKRVINYNKSLEFSHLEFVFGTRIKHLINDPVIKILLDDLNMR